MTTPNPYTEAMEKIAELTDQSGGKSVKVDMAPLVAEAMLSTGMPNFHMAGGTMELGDFSARWSISVTGTCMYIFPDEDGRQPMIIVPMRPMLDQVCDQLMKHYGYDDKGKRPKKKSAKKTAKKKATKRGKR